MYNGRLRRTIGSQHEASNHGQKITTTHTYVKRVYSDNKKITELKIYCVKQLSVLRTPHRWPLLTVMGRIKLCTHISDVDVVSEVSGWVQMQTKLSFAFVKKHVGEAGRERIVIYCTHRTTCFELCCSHFYLPFLFLPTW